MMISCQFKEPDRERAEPSINNLQTLSLEVLMQSLVICRSCLMAGTLRVCFEIGQACFFYSMLVTSMEDGMLLLIARVMYPVDTALKQVTL